MVKRSPLNAFPTTVTVSTEVVIQYMFFRDDTRGKCSHFVCSHFVLLRDILACPSGSPFAFCRTEKRPNQASSRGT